jgi:hypothetical protein
MCFLNTNRYRCRFPSSFGSQLFSWCLCSSRFPSSLFCSCHNCFEETIKYSVEFTFFCDLSHYYILLHNTHSFKMPKPKLSSHLSRQENLFCKKVLTQYSICLRFQKHNPHVHVCIYNQTYLDHSITKMKWILHCGKNSLIECIELKKNVINYRNEISESNSSKAVQEVYNLKKHTFIK